MLLLRMTISPASNGRERTDVQSSTVTVRVTVKMILGLVVARIHILTYAAYSVLGIP